MLSLVRRRAGHRIGVLGAALLVSLAVLVPGAGVSSLPGVAERTGSVNGGAAAFAPSQRGEQVQIRQPPDPPLRCERVIVIGDSLTQNWQWHLDRGLREAGFTAKVDAQHSRRIPASVAAPYSGVRAAWTVRATFGEAECWVVALGSNDLSHGADDPGAAGALITEMLAAVTPGADVWWMNVNYHRQAGWPFNFPGATATFNGVLDARAAADPKLHVIDWYGYSEGNLWWFFDPVHVTETGTIARSRQIVDALPR